MGAALATRKVGAGHKALHSAAAASVFTKQPPPSAAGAAGVLAGALAGAGRTAAMGLKHGAGAAAAAAAAGSHAGGGEGHGKDESSTPPHNKAVSSWLMPGGTLLPKYGIVLLMDAPEEAVGSIPIKGAPRPLVGAGGGALRNEVRVKQQVLQLAYMLHACGGGCVAAFGLSRT